MFVALAEIGLGIPYLAELKGDNNGSISIAENKKNHNCVKHIDIRHHFIRQAVEDGRISITYVLSTENLADLFTKALPQPQHQKLCATLCLTKNWHV